MSFLKNFVKKHEILKAGKLFTKYGGKLFTKYEVPKDFNAYKVGTAFLKKSVKPVITLAAIGTIICVILSERKYENELSSFYLADREIEKIRQISK